MEFLECSLTKGSVPLVGERLEREIQQAGQALRVRDLGLIFITLRFPQALSEATPKSSPQNQECLLSTADIASKPKTKNTNPP